MIGGAYSNRASRSRFVWRLFHLEFVPGVTCVRKEVCPHEQSSFTVIHMYQGGIVWVFSLCAQFQYCSSGVGTLAIRSVIWRPLARLDSAPYYPKRSIGWCESDHHSLIQLMHAEVHSPKEVSRKYFLLNLNGNVSHRRREGLWLLLIFFNVITTSSLIIEAIQNPSLRVAGNGA